MTREHLIKRVTHCGMLFNAYYVETDLDEVVSKNVAKLEKRYPGGLFDPWYSENRHEGDI